MNAEETQSQSLHRERRHVVGRKGADWSDPNMSPGAENSTASGSCARGP